MSQSMSRHPPLAPRGTPIHPALNKSWFLTRIKKSSRACDNCRVQRRRCAGARPCTGCHALGEECRYSGPDLRKREGWKAQIRALELRNAYLERIIQRLSCNCTDGAGLHTQPAIDYYALPAIHEGPLKSITSLSPLADGNALAPRSNSSGAIQPVPQASPSSRELEHLFYLAIARHPPQDRHDQSDHLSMLPEEQISRLAIDAFFQYASTLFYVATVEKSTQLLEKVYHTSNATLQDVCELCALAAIGSQYNTVEIPDKARAAYFYIASRRLEKAVMEDSLQALRIFIYLCMSLIMEKSLSARLLIGSAFNLARGKMLADVDTERLNGSKDDEHRRTLQTLIFFAGWLSYTLGYQSCLSKAEIDMVLDKTTLQNQGTENLPALRTCLIQYYMTKLILLASELQQEITSYGPNYWSHADMLFARLDAWHTSLPPDLKLTALLINPHEHNRNPVTEYQMHALYLMHLLYIDIRLQLYRQLLTASCTYITCAEEYEALSDSMFEKVPRHVANTTVGFAVQLTRIASLMYAESAISARCWLVIRSVFDAGVVLLLAVCQRYRSSPETSDVDDLFQRVDTCLTVLAFCSRHDVAASRIRNMLDAVFCQLRHITSRFKSRPDPGSSADDERDSDYMLDIVPPAGSSVLTIANHLLNLMSPAAKVWV